MSARWLVCCALLAGVAGVTLSAQEDKPAKPATTADKPAAPSAADKAGEVARELYSGKVVMLVDALKRKGIKSYPELKDQVVLETETGDLWPIISDWRGRAFFHDERLRDRPVELIARKHPGVPYLQVLMIFTFNEQGERQYTDYWCDICSIPMYEIKDCECCQGPIRLRYQKQALPGYVKDPKEK